MGMGWLSPQALPYSTSIRILPRNVRVAIGSELTKRPVDELHTHGALAHGRRDTFHAARPYIADREDARSARLQHLGSARERPSGLLEFVGVEVGAGLDEVPVVQRD